MTDLLQRFVSYYQPACGVKLSVRQKQRLTIARLFLGKSLPRLLREISHTIRPHSLGPMLLDAFPFNLARPKEF